MGFADWMNILKGSRPAAPLRPEDVREQCMRLYGVPSADNFDLAAPAVLLSERQQRQLATGGLLLFGWWLSLKQIMPLFPEVRQRITGMLARDWSIATAAELEATMRRLLETGHRAQLQPQLAQNQAYWQAKFEAYDALRQLPVRSVAGWDCGRVVSLAYWGLLTGLLDQATAFDYMAQATDLARQHLHSWEELAGSYLAGRIMWNPDHLDDVPQCCRFAQLLLLHEQSVWRLLPWAG